MGNIILTCERQDLFIIRRWENNSTTIFQEEQAEWKSLIFDLS